ncbi:MAG: hypothetical protein AB7E85_04230 [Pseudobdellovibrionaceae bacterium]
MKKLALTTAALALMNAPVMANEMQHSNNAPHYTQLEAFEVMDLDQNYIVNPVEFDWAQAHYQGLQNFSFEDMDTNGNGIVTRDEASAKPYGFMGDDAEVAMNRTESRIDRSTPNIDTDGDGY